MEPNRFQSKKLYYSISEVSKVSGVPGYLLRKWETIFPKLSPMRNTQGNRIYTNKDLTIILEIKKAIQEEGYTIQKTKEIIATNEEPTLSQAEIEQKFKKSSREEDLEILIDEQKKILIELKIFVKEAMDIIDESKALDEPSTDENVPNLFNADKSSSTHNH